MDANGDAFVEAATDGRRDHAEARLAANPEISRDPWARLVLGRGWEGDPNEKGGPRGWPPLLYVCHSVFADVGLARDLLGRGADPNSGAATEWGRTTALYGAAGVLHDPALTRVLLEAGADTDDGESLYHSVEADDPACLRLLLDAGAETRGTNALAHALDYDRVEPVRLLLEAGADPNAGALLAHAVRRGRGPEFLQLLADHSAELDARGGETWRGDVRLRTAYAHARLRSHDDSADLLAGLGASTDVDPADAVVAAAARGERPTEPLPEDLDPDRQEVLILGALRGSLDVVVDLLGPNFTGVVGGSPEGTLLHHAAWIGSPALVRELLALGADATAVSSAQFSTPLAWAVLASKDDELPGRDYVAVAESLVASGAEIEPRFLEVAAGPLLQWLQLVQPGEL